MAEPCGPCLKRQSELADQGRAHSVAIAALVAVVALLALALLRKGLLTWQDLGIPAAGHG